MSIISKLPLMFAFTSGLFTHQPLYASADYLRSSERVSMTVKDHETLMKQLNGFDAERAAFHQQIARYQQIVDAREARITELSKENERLRMQSIKMKCVKTQH